MPKHENTRICCWHEIHFDIQIYIQSHIHPHAHTLKKKKRESAAGMKFISIFKSLFNLIDIHMPKHKNTGICCWHEIHFDIQIGIHKCS